MVDVKGCDLLDHKRISPKFTILSKLLLPKKCPKLGIQIPNNGDDNQSHHILLVFLNQIDR